jgi:hypothetical protein
MRPNHPFAADVADAARRAALIDDVRLVRVLDVGNDGEVGFVVSEYVDGDSLATLVERSPLSPPAVRRIIGEVAQGLDGAAGRGLHHLRLTPRSVIVCKDGTVKISGTAVEAAAAGLEPDHAATAGRVDTVALVALLYSGLTGRWPMGDAGFPPAPRGEGGGPVPPADLVPGVPNDLDTLCVVTLGSVDDGPRSPAELVRELAPWPSAQQAPLRVAPRRLPVEGAAASDPAPPAPGRPFANKRTPRHPNSAAAQAAQAGRAPQAPNPMFEAGKPPDAIAAPAVTPAPTNPTTANPTTANPAQIQPTKVTAAEAAPSEATSAQATEPSALPRRSATLFPSPSVAGTGSPPIPQEPVTDSPRRMDTLFTPPTGNPKMASPQPPGFPSAPTSVAPAKAFPGNGIPARNTGAVRKLDSLGPPSEPLSLWGADWSNGPPPPSPLETTGPFPIVIPPETPPRGQSRLVIVSVGAVLLLVLLVAGFSLRNFGSSDNVIPSDAAGPLPTASAAPLTPAPGVTSELPTPEATTASPTPTPTTPVEIDSIRAIDPQGDGDEDTGRSKLAIDGDPSTSWKSDTYRSSTFGGLKKGVGLAIKLEKPAVVHSVTIEVEGSGGAVEVRTADSPDLDSSTVVGKSSIKNGHATVRADNAAASKYVILWFTKLPSVGGKYKVEVSEVQLK